MHEEIFHFFLKKFFISMSYKLMCLAGDVCSNDRLRMQLHFTSALTSVMLMKVVSSQQLFSVRQERIHDRHDQDALDVREYQVAQ